MLLLFDIDGTLLDERASPAGKAMSAALAEVHGVDTRAIRTEIETAGRTHGEIARAILLDAGVSAERIDALAGAVRDRCCERWAEIAPDDLSWAVLPGVSELLECLGDQDPVRLGLLTGNYEAIARAKLERAGLGRGLATGPGAFGSDAEDRAALPPIARRRAGRPGQPYPRRDTIVIGDTPQDIACARADDLRCIAVASGSCRADALAGADTVVRDAFGLRPALQGLASGVSRPAG